MNIQDTLNIILILGFVILVGCFIYITYYLVQALKSITSLVDDWENTSQGIKNKLKLNFLSVIPAIILGLAGKIIRRKRG
ncbi:MAG: hypothetical protein Q8Q91_01985 [Candidatus Daviesbacteria bacterium]|nr:hypothetical protein [Candidatus Daviesbacteria bacterium]